MSNRFQNAVGFRFPLPQSRNRQQTLPSCAPASIGAKARYGGSIPFSRPARLPPGHLPASCPPPSPSGFQLPDLPASSAAKPKSGDSLPAPPPLPEPKQLSPSANPPTGFAVPFRVSCQSCLPRRIPHLLHSRSSRTETRRTGFAVPHVIPARRILPDIHGLQAYPRCPIAGGASPSEAAEPPSARIRLPCLCKKQTTVKKQRKALDKQTTM